MEPEPEVPEAFKDYVASRGWTFRSEWVYPYHDEETNETYGGYWSLLIFREAMLPSGDLHYRAVECSHLIARESSWPLLVNLAQAEFERQHEELTRA